MHKPIRPYLADIRRAIERVELLTDGKSLIDYSADWRLKWLVERAIQIISEAVRRLPAEVIAGYPEIPWPSIAAIGNILRHEYDSIADSIIFEVVLRDLPPLKAAVLAIEANLDEPDE
jgi:uncharacterized protein with HEPN domain